MVLRLKGISFSINSKQFLIFVVNQSVFQMAKVYVASSWRNQHFESVVNALRAAGHEVYDFRNPPHGQGSFHWGNLDPDYMNWTTRQYRDGLRDLRSELQFSNDISAMEWADTCVLVLPCGRSAHTEAGWFAGRGCRTFAYLPEPQEPELMYKLFDMVTDDLSEIISSLRNE